MSCFRITTCPNSARRKRWILYTSAARRAVHHRVGQHRRGSRRARNEGGAQDYVFKERLARLPAAIERELRDADERRARQEAEARIRLLAYYDQLTSLPNRRLSVND